MTKTDTMLTYQEFLELLDRRGSDENAWPPQQHQAVTELLSRDAAARTALAQARDMDNLLRALPVPEFPGLAMRIGGQPLPRRQADLGDRLLDWLLPGNGLQSVWRPALAACLPLFFGVVVGNYFHFGITTDDSSENWDDELAMISLTDYSQNQVEL